MKIRVGKKMCGNTYLKTENSCLKTQTKHSLRIQIYFFKWSSYGKKKAMSGGSL